VRRRTALHQAAEEGRAEAVRLLLTHGADIEARDADDLTPLMVACMFANRTDAAILALIDGGADAQAVRPSDAMTPLVAAAGPGAGRREVLEALLSAGADVNGFEGTDWPPLLSAAKNGQDEAIREDRS
jgi:ankyrin repeat protein